MISGGESEIIIPEKPAGVILYETLKEKDRDAVQLLDFQTGREFTYGEILDLSTKLAINLCKSGVKPQDVIGVVSQNKWEILIVHLATLYVGATVNPLNPEYTLHEIGHNFEKTRPKLVFCSEKTAKNVRELQKQTDYIESVVIFEETEETQQGFKKMLNASQEEINAYQPQNKIDINDTCMVLTSSGTTGLPKSVELTHRSIHNFFTQCKDPEIINLTSEDTAVLFMPMFHIFGFYILIGGFLQGVKNVLLNKFNPIDYLKIIQREKVTKLLLVPSVLNFLAKHDAVKSYDLSSVKDIICGAASLSKDVIEDVHGRLGLCARQLYGMTETGGLVTMNAPSSKNSQSVGKVLPNFCVKICPEGGTKCLNHGEPGEIHVKGAAVMKCYKGNPEETNKTKLEGGWIRSGDLGYTDENGYVYIIGRLKEIIKHKGFQVSPAELENLLEKYPGVQEVSVVGRPDKRDGELPTAFIVRKNGASLTSQEIIDYVAENISVQKHLTGGVVFVDELPKNAVGKVLRNKLVQLLVQ